MWVGNGSSETSVYCLPFPKEDRKSTLIFAERLGVGWGEEGLGVVVVAFKQGKYFYYFIFLLF